MPRPCKVKVEEAVEAICNTKNTFPNGELPAYTNSFYCDVSKKLENKWSGYDVYTNLREDRRQLRTKVFEQLGIIVEKK